MSFRQQDQYASEQYSEDPPDAESARRLLEFGEDYRNDLDSLSDCPSSWSTAGAPRSSAYRSYHHPPKRSPLKRFRLGDRPRNDMRILDSDSDVEELVSLVGIANANHNKTVCVFNKLILSSRCEISQYVSSALFYIHYFIYSTHRELNVLT